jgi:hypothetical protein
MYFRGVVLKVEEWKFIDLFVGCHWYILQSFAVVFRPYGLIPPKLKKKEIIWLSNLFTPKNSSMSFSLQFNTHKKQKKDTIILNNNYNF